MASRKYWPTAAQASISACVHWKATFSISQLLYHRQQVPPFAVGTTSLMSFAVPRTSGPHFPRTITVRVTSSAWLPEASATLYVMVYRAGSLGFTGLTTVMFAVALVPPEPSRFMPPPPAAFVSSAVAPALTYSL